MSNWYFGEETNTSLYGNFRTRTFSDIYPSVEGFITAYRESGLNDAELTDANLTILYYELYASYGNSHIASSDENQFKYKMYMIIKNKALIWQKDLEVQKKLRHLKDEEILRTSKYINSHAYNPGQVGERVDSEGDHILDYINDQTATKETGSYLAALTAYMDTLSDVSTGFIKEFKRLFIVVVNPELPLWYED